jgi:hypothetical protein
MVEYVDPHTSKMLSNRKEKITEADIVGIFTQ